MPKRSPWRWILIATIGLIALQGIIFAYVYLQRDQGGATIPAEVETAAAVGERALERAKSGSFAGALSILEDARASADPAMRADLAEQEVVVRLEISRQLSNNGDIAAARNGLQKILELSPGHRQAMAMLAELDKKGARSAPGKVPAAAPTAAAPAASPEPTAAEASTVAAAAAATETASTTESVAATAPPKPAPAAARPKRKRPAPRRYRPRSRRSRVARRPSSPPKPSPAVTSPTTEPEPEPPKKARLFVLSTPAAAVRLNNEFLGITPLKDVSLQPGAYTLTIRASGFEPEVRAFKADPAQRVFFDVKLKAVASKAPPAKAASAAAKPKPAKAKRNIPRANFYVIAHPATKLRSVATATLRSIFLGAKQYWGAGGRISAILRPAGSRAGRAFYGRVVKMSVSRFREHWDRLELAGRGFKPSTVGGAAQVARVVSRRRGAISFIAASELAAVESFNILIVPRSL